MREAAPAPAVVATSNATAPSDEVKAALMAAEFALEDGRRGSAARLYAQAAARSSDPAIAERAARVAVLAGDATLAREALDRWQALDPQADALRQVEANVLLAEGDVAGARQRLEGLLADDTADGRLRVGQALLASKDRAAARALIDGWLGNEPPPGGAATLLMLGQVAQQLEAPQLARRAADLAVARFADDAQAWAWLGSQAFSAGDPLTGRTALTRAVALAPADVRLRLTWAAALYRLGEPANAARTLGEIPADDEVLAAQAAYAAASADQVLIGANYAALEALPEPRPAARLALLGQMGELAESPQQALGWYRQVPEGPEYINARIRIAVVQGLQAQFEAAYQTLSELRRSGIGDDQQLASTFLIEAEIAQRAGTPARVRASYQAGLAVLPGHPSLHYAYGLWLAESDEIDAALAQFRAIVDADPDNAEALNALGYTMADRTDRHTEALAYIERALALSPQSAAIIDSMGWVLYRLGRASEALGFLERAFALEPGAEIGAHLGEVLWVLGRQQDARRVWQQAAEIEAGHRLLIETRTRLEGRR